MANFVSKMFKSGEEFENFLKTLISASDLTLTYNNGNIYLKNKNDILAKVDFTALQDLTEWKNNVDDGITAVPVASSLEIYAEEYTPVNDRVGDISLNEGKLYAISIDGKNTVVLYVPEGSDNNLCYSSFSTIGDGKCLYVMYNKQEAIVYIKFVILASSTSGVYNPRVIYIREI